MDIPTLAKTIATQTGVEYSLNMQNTSLQKKVQLKPGKWKVEDVMKEVQDQLGLNYKFIGDHILFTDYKPAKKQDTIVKKQPPIKIITPKKDTIIPIPAQQQTPLVIYYLQSPYPVDSLPTEPLNTDAIQVASRSFIEEEMELERLALQKELLFKKPRWYQPYTFAGAQINDITYLNIAAKAGIQYLYAIGMVGANLNGVRFTYGVGLRIPTETNKNSLHLEFTAGQIHRSSTDSSYQGRINERLASYGVSWSTYVGPRMYIQFEATYHKLKKMNVDNAFSYPSPENNLFKFGSLIYNIQSNYGSDYQLRGWVGTRVSVFYNLSKERTH